MITVLKTIVSSATQAMEISRDRPTAITGERINATGRKYVKATFIARAIHAGLPCPITNPPVPEVAIAVLGVDLSMGRDQYCMNWIKAYRQRR